MAEDETLGFRIGQRVHAMGNPRRTDTICYIRPVAGHSSSWIGVDWDDGDSKHDDSVNGTRYFTVRSNKSGFLVRAKNLSAWISFVEALHLRYRTDLTKEEEDEMYVFSRSNKHVLVQLVGRNKVEEKLKKFEELTSAAISYLGVSLIGNTYEINALVSKSIPEESYERANINESDSEEEVQPISGGSVELILLKSFKTRRR